MNHAALNGLGVASPPTTEGLDRVIRQRQGLILVSSPTGCGKHRLAKALRDAKAQQALRFFDEVRSREQACDLVHAAASGLAFGVISGYDATGAWLRLRDMSEADPDPVAALASRDVSSLAVRLVPAASVGRVLVVEIIQRDGNSHERWTSGHLWADASWHVSVGHISQSEADAFCGTASDGSQYGIDEIDGAWS